MEENSEVIKPNESVEALEQANSAGPVVNDVNSAGPTGNNVVADKTCSSLEPVTYLGLRNTEEGGMHSTIEFDLVTARQKGQEIRYLSVSMNSINKASGEHQESLISIDEQSFGLIKEFFTNLEWNQ